MITCQGGPRGLVSAEGTMANSVASASAASPCWLPATLLRVLTLLAWHAI